MNDNTDAIRQIRNAKTALRDTADRLESYAKSLESEPTADLRAILNVVAICSDDLARTNHTAVRYINAAVEYKLQAQPTTR